ncbi:MAG: S46 family peptidase, partial [Porphyromonadaceae bacterium]|nr:S46 family peptidase [Porphyromonadaceae bacterium]
MNIKKLLLAAVMLMSFAPLAKADKGMWILAELRKQNIERMKELGFTLPVDSLYSLDKPSVANAVVIFGGGCTGITVSNTGLIFTNHHCGYDAIQSQSSVDHDYLKDGFVSQSYKEELPIPGLQVRYLRKVENVTNEVVSKLGDVKDEIERIKKADAIGAEIAKKYAKPHQEAKVVPFYTNNEYFLLVYDVFSDVRMVFAPPSSVGKFGGDTDNWMWPRHTGDFSVFRVYADQNNQPADYNANNKPYTPVYYAAVSMNGYKPGDYAMTIGYPGSTDRYLTSWGVENRMYNENEPRIEVRGIKQAIWKKDMLADQATRIKYASKYARSANYWKNSIGMNKALVALGVLDNKRAEEQAFDKWAQNKDQYRGVLSDLKKAYAESGELSKELNYMYESMFGGTEIVRIARFGKQALEDQARKEQILAYMDQEIYKDYVPSLDEKVLGAMLTVLRKHLPTEKLPDIYKYIDKKFKGDCDAYAKYVFANSVMPFKDKLMAASNLPEKKLQKLIANDP